MPIIKFTKNAVPAERTLLNKYPDDFVKESVKQTDDWIKLTLDYFATIAMQQYRYNRRKFRPNYEIVKGQLKRSYFYNQEPQLQGLIDTLLKEEDLPKHIKPYSIMNPPINNLVGELSKRPDNVFVKAFDADSQSAELQYKTEICNRLITETIKERILAKAAEEGVEFESPEELEQMTAERAAKELSSYTSQAEKWGSRVLEYMKMRFNIKEKSEEAFRDLLIAGCEGYHIYEDNSPLGFNVEVVNREKLWELKSGDKKYTSDPMDASNGAYAAGTIDIMEFSEIIHKFNLTKAEIDQLRKESEEGYGLGRESNLVNGRGKTGMDSVEYDTYDPIAWQYRRVMESELYAGSDTDLSDMLGLSGNISTFGSKFIVVRSYHCSKKMIGKLTYIDEEGVEQEIIVDENYKSGDHPQQIALEWGWINQWYQGTKIGESIYYMKPFELLDYCPIIAVTHENKNMSSPVSLVDQMKDLQMLVTVLMNKIFLLTEKDMGVVLLMPLRQVPVPKDGDYQDAVDAWEAEARERGVVWIDDSPENAQGAAQFNQHKAVDLSRSREIQELYNIAVQLRNECWKMVGLTEQRLGESRATETATGINSSLTQSYAQTEPLFTQHSYNLNKLYQALLDAALYIESHKPTSTISYITTEGEHAFVQIAGNDLKLKELGVLISDRAEDARNFQELRQLSQALLQNGASPYEMSMLYGTKSIRKIQEVFKQFKEKQDGLEQQAQQTQQQQLQQQQAQFEQAQQLMQLQEEKRIAFEAYENEQDRLNKERIALIGAASKQGSSALPVDNSIDLSKIDLERQKADRDYQIKVQDLTQKQQQILSQQGIAMENMKLQREKMANDRLKMQTDYKIAKENKNASEMKARKKK